MYKFSENTTAEFYGRKFYEIQNESGKCVAYSERVFEIPEAVRFLGGGKCLIFEKANFYGGYFHGGNFHGGDFSGGYFRGGDFRGGDFYGGDFRGGDFHGGYFHGGNFHGGNFRGGDYEVLMLQIQGSKHFCYAYFSEEDNSVCLGIGCERHTIEWWLENYASIGQEENYTDEQVDEYKLYIDLFAARYPSK
mgnify:CR=1 FL=1